MTTQRNLRLWPGVVIAALMVVVRFVLPAIAPEMRIFGIDVPLMAVFGGLAGALAIVVWWLFFSRVSWSERLGALAVMILAVLAVRPLTHISIQNGMMGMMFVLYAVPLSLSLALVGWAAISRRLSPGSRRVTMVVAMLIGCGVWTLARTDGLMGGAPELAWRWTPSAEERLLAEAKELPLAPAAARPEPPPAPEASEPAPAASAAAAVEVPDKPSAPAADNQSTPAAIDPVKPKPHVESVDWPGFRGPNRDGVIRNPRIEANWSTSPPVEMWRRPIGPGWSSFAVSGDLLYTQEQRGDDEIVAAYRVSTGEPVWAHRDPVRFWESNGGAGPRGTPTVSNGRVYALGATGILNALDATTGALLWSRSATSDTGVEVPGWGIASSPLVINDVVIVATSGRLAGYEVTTGDLRWLGPEGGAGYSSPHLATIEGIAHVLLLRGSRTISVAPADGTLLWEHIWQPGVSIVQPAVASGDLLITSADAMGGLATRRIAVEHGSAGWTVSERWTSRGLKPYFNDFVVHKGAAYGFDGSILASISLEDGERNWKGGRYGNGQMLLLAEQDLLLVLSEEGELALVSATPDKFTEVARFQALDGKTWNHPVIVGDVLLVRNGEEMAAFRLPLTPR